MKRMKQSKKIVEIVSALFILLFFYTAINKWLFVGEFIYVLSESPLIGPFAPLVGWSIIILELIITALLFFPRTRLLGLKGAFILMVAFAGYIAYMVAFTPKLPCSCGGVIGLMNWSQHLVFNIFFTFLGLTGIILERKQPVTHSPSKPRPAVST
jgi:putative oxidoreductase